MGTKKKYDFPVNRQNTPDLKLYNWLLGLFWGFSGFNCILSHFILQTKSDEAPGFLLALGIISLLLIPLKLLDDRKENRGLLAVVGSGFSHFYFTLNCFLSGFFLVVAAYVCQWIVCGFCIYWFKGRKRRHR